LSEQNENEEDAKSDGDLRSRISASRVVSAAFAVSGVWVAVFAIIWLAGPVSSAFLEAVVGLSDLLDISTSAVTAGIFVSTYITFAMLVMLNPSVRKSLFRLAGVVVKQEKSFHLGANAARLSKFSVTAGSDNPFRNGDEFRRKIDDRLAKMENKLSYPAEVKVGEGEWEAIRSQAIVAVTEKLADDVRERVKEKLWQSRILELENASLARLSDQIVVLGSRANLALVTGVIFCVGGLLILWWTLANVEFSTPEAVSGSLYWAEFLKVFAPRLSLVLIVEIIGFFFLKLFRGALDEVRLTQNEITNVEMKLIAANLALSESRDDLPKVIHELATTERNMIIDKGQTTVELEKARGVREVEGRYVDSLVALLKGRR